MQHNTQTALEHYGSWENLLKMIDDKLSFYLQIPRIFQLMQDDGLHPADVLCRTKPAYFSDAIALLCLSSYDEDETDHQALERCMTIQLHERFTRMEKADRTVVSFRGSNWEAYTTDDLLRLAWRLRANGVQIPFYLTRSAEAELADEFVLTASAENAVLLNRTKHRIYELPSGKALSFEDFSRELRRFFRLATEEDGYFIPEYVWLCTDAPTQDVAQQTP